MQPQQKQDVAHVDSRQVRIIADHGQVDAACTLLRAMHATSSLAARPRSLAFVGAANTAVDAVGGPVRPSAAVRDNCISSWLSGGAARP
jgi:hypothetical protein